MKVKQMAAADLSIRTPSDSAHNKFGADMYKEVNMENILSTPTDKSLSKPATPLSSQPRGSF